MHSSNINYHSHSSNNDNNNQSKPGQHAFAQNGIYQRNDSIKPYNSYWTQVQPVMRNSLGREDVSKSYFQGPSYQTASNAASDSAQFCNTFLQPYAQTNEVGEPHDRYSSKTQRSQLANAYYTHMQQQQALKTRHTPKGSPNHMPDVHNLSVAHVQPVKHERSPRHDHHHKQHQKELARTSMQHQQRQQQPHQQSGEPTWDCILSDRSSNNFSTEQHYQHYYSYIYNKSPTNKPKHTPRRLPMNIPTKLNVDHNDVALGEFVCTPVSTGGDFATTSRKKTHVLKEQLSNNNVLNGFDNGEWSRDYAEDKLMNLYDDEYDIRAESGNQTKTNIDLHRSKRQYRTHADIPEPISPVHVVEGGDASMVNNNNLPKPQTPKLAIPRLPLTPKRVKGGATQRKVVPSVHRVLLYNNQSPRMARKPRTKTTENDHRSTEVLVLKPPEVKTSEEKTSIGFERDDEYDEDDDLDNVSNFNESDESSIGSDGEDGYRAYAYKLTHSVDRMTTTQSFLSSPSSEASIKAPESLLVPSLFPNVPPYLSFSSNTQKGPNVPPELHRILKWRVTNIMPKVVRLVLANSGMRLLKKTNDWMGVWGKHLKSPCFKTVRAYQKINHLPGSFRIGRKDSCWKNLQKQMSRHSKREFGFMPRTYIIPHDLCVLRKHWPKYAQRNTKWIIKPPASARGAGIRVVNRWAQIPKRRPLIVQKYIERPLLINGSKFDLRLYVLVTSMNPLRVYMYHNGLARFASVKYSAKPDTLNDRCMHLTNYSINKFSSNYSKNEDVNACHGHKWTIKSLWTYLANRGVRTDYLWEALRSLVVRTILAGENSMNHMIKMNVESKYSVFELFGFDVILDADLVPWLLEVNISPSLHSELPLDAHVKAPLVQGVLNTALYNVPPKLTQEKQKELAAEFMLPPGSPFCYDKRMYINYLSREEKVKHNAFCRKSLEDRDEYLNGILNKLTPDDVRTLVIAEDELARCAPLERIFPTDQTHKYLKYTDTPRYYNRLLDAWETRYAHNRSEGIALLSQYCKDKYHLQVPAPPAKKIIKFRPRTLVVTRPNALTTSTLHWKQNWTSQKASKRICIKYKSQNQKTTTTANDEVVACRRMKQQPEENSTNESTDSELTETDDNVD